MIRKLNLNDLAKLEKYAKFPMPNVLNPRCEIQWALLDDSSSELVGLVIGKKTCEVMMILDETHSWTVKTKAWIEAFNNLDYAGQILGYDDVHAFVAGNSEESQAHAKLMKRCGFVPATGIPLYYILGSSKWLKDKRKQLLECPKVSQESPQHKLKQDSSEDQQELLVTLA